MTVDKVYAVISTDRLDQSKEWYTRLFGRAPDLHPMAEVYEWYFGDGDRDRDIEWMTSDTTFDAFTTATLRSIDGMIFGRTAHALLADFWPTAGTAPDASADLIEQARLMNTLPTYVLTHDKEERTGWANSHPIAVNDVPGRKQKSARPIAVFAGAKAAQALLQRGLIDEVRIIRYRSSWVVGRRFSTLTARGAI